MPQANLLEGVKIPDNRPQTYKIELKTYSSGTNHLSSLVWYNPISTARKIFRRALATDFQGNQVTYSLTLSLLTLHRTVPTRLPMSPSALRLLACTALAALWLPLWGCFPVPAAAATLPTMCFFVNTHASTWVLQSLCCIRSFASIKTSSNRVVVSDRDGDLIHRQHLNWKHSRIIRELEIVVTFGRRSGLAATIPTLILITESCLLLLPPTSPQHNRTDQFFLSAFHLESIHKFSIFFKPCSICLTQRT
jgi:hypothetical protein